MRTPRLALCTVMITQRKVQSPEVETPAQTNPQRSHFELFQTSHDACVHLETVQTIAAENIHVWQESSDVKSVCLHLTASEKYEIFHVHFPQMINFAENSLQLLFLGARYEKLPLLELNGGKFITFRNDQAKMFEKWKRNSHWMWIYINNSERYIEMFCIAIENQK